MPGWRRAGPAPPGPRPWPYLAVAVLIAVVLAVALLVQRNELSRLERVQAAAERSHERRKEQADMLFRLREAEAEQRGYLLTGGRDFLDGYRETRRGIEERVTPPSTLFADAPDVLRLVAARLALLDRGVALRQSEDRAGAVAMVARDRGERIMARLRQMIDQARRQELERVVDQRRDSSSQRMELDRSVLAAAVGVTLLLSMLYMLWQRRRFGHARVVAGIEAAARHTTILESTSDAILIVSPAGTIEMMNAAACKMLGYDAESTRALDVAKVIHLGNGGGSLHERVGLSQGVLAQPYLADRIACTRAGDEIPVDVALGVLSLPGGDHLVVSLRDITERKRVENAKDELVSTVSHELRTPLTSVVGSLGLLRTGAAGELPAAAARLVEIAENNSRRLIRLINDMLDIDGIAAGKLEIQRLPIDARRVLEQACTGSEGLARSHGVVLACIVPDRPAMVAADGDRLVQVVSNLVSNAIRVSPPDGRVEVSLVEGDCGTIVRVDDRGGGVPPAFRDRIFGRFERASPPDGAGGTGLGLAISREIVERHDGRIWFEDREGGGTRFAFSLPRIGALSEQARLEHAEPKQAAAEQRLLVCTANEDLAARLAGAGRDDGYVVDIAEDEPTARGMVTLKGHAAMLVDLDLPPGGGLALAEGLCGREETDSLAVALVRTGHDRRSPATARFPILHLPIGGGRTQDAAQLRAALTPYAGNRPTVLHLDDDRDLLAVVAAALSEEARVVSVGDLAAARAVLEQMTPDLAILDPGLPEGAGLDLLPLLVRPDGSRVPTIVYSAQDLPGDAGDQVSAVLVKSRSSLPDLRAAVRQALADGAPVPRA